MQVVRELAKCSCQAFHHTHVHLCLLLSLLLAAAAGWCMSWSLAADRHPTTPVCCMLSLPVVRELGKGS
jgi:hypothetical protein